MNVVAGKREFRIFDLFCHDDEAASTRPFDGWEVARVLNLKAEEMYPDRFAYFVCPEDSGLSQWNVRFNENGYDYDEHGQNKFKTYPTWRVYDERSFRRNLPAELDEVLLELDKLDLVL